MFDSFMFVFFTYAIVLFIDKVEANFSPPEGRIKAAIQRFFFEMNSDKYLNIRNEIKNCIVLDVDIMNYTSFVSCSTKVKYVDVADKKRELYVLYILKFNGYWFIPSFFYGKWIVDSAEEINPQTKS